METQIRMTLCPNLHTYNSAMFSCCPICASMGSTVPPDAAPCQVWPPAPPKGLRPPNQHSDFDAVPFDGYISVPPAPFTPILGHLTYLDGPENGKVLHLHPEYCYIYRDPDNIPFLTSESSSMADAMLVYRNKHIGIAPTNTTNIQVNGEPVSRYTPLNTGDVITVSSTRLALSIVPEEALEWYENPTQFAEKDKSLAAGTILSGTGGARAYRMDSVQSKWGSTIRYAAFETDTNRRVDVTEYLPARIAYRTRDGISVQALPGQEQTYQNGMEDFQATAKALLSVEDLPSMVHILDHFEANGTAYLISEYLDGTPLNACLDQLGKVMSAQELLPRLKPVIRDLGIMHRRGILHRDICPNNLIRLPDGTIKLTDFSCARSMENETPTPIVVRGGFSPVEQYLSKGQGPFTDIYALAATLYYCTTGMYLSEAVTRLTSDTLCSPTALEADLSAGQEAAILWGLAVRPEARPQTMEAFETALYGQPSARGSVLVRCANGHFYNEAIHHSCPICGTGKSRLSREDTSQFSTTPPPNSTWAARLPSPFSPCNPFDDGMFVSGLDLHPDVFGHDLPRLPPSTVVGRLTCTDGLQKGEAWELHACHNTILVKKRDILVSRDKVRIPEDRESIYGESPYIEFTEYRSFLLCRGAGVTRLNGRSVRNYVSLKDGDIITIGSTQLAFTQIPEEEWNKMS